MSPQATGTSNTETNKTPPQTGTAYYQPETTPGKDSTRTLSPGNQMTITPPRLQTPTKRAGNID